MKRKPLNLTVTWVALLILTMASTTIAEAGHRFSVTIFAIFTIAALKAELVLSEFMEVGRAERAWSWVYGGWIVAVATILTISNLI